SGTYVEPLVINDFGRLKEAVAHLETARVAAKASNGFSRDHLAPCRGRIGTARRLLRRPPTLAQIGDQRFRGGTEGGQTCGRGPWTRSTIPISETFRSELWSRLCFTLVIHQSANSSICQASAFPSTCLKAHQTYWILSSSPRLLRFFPITRTSFPRSPAYLIAMPSSMYSS